MTETNHVLVANLPAMDQTPGATTIFAASGLGALFGRYQQRADYEGAEIGPRLVGRHNHRLVLNALQGGYQIDANQTRERGRINRSRKD